MLEHLLLQLIKASVWAESSYFNYFHRALFAPVVYRRESGRCHSLPFFLKYFLLFYLSRFSFHTNMINNIFILTETFINWRQLHINLVLQLLYQLFTIFFMCTFCLLIQPSVRPKHPSHLLYMIPLKCVYNPLENSSPFIGVFLFSKFKKYINKKEREQHLPILSVYLFSSLSTDSSDVYWQ